MTLRKQVIFLLTCVLLRHREVLEYPVGLPPPVVFRLSKFGLSIVAVQVGEVCVRALDALGPGIGWNSDMQRPTHIVNKA